jgi:hypothetical protein
MTIYLGSKGERWFTSIYKCVDEGGLNAKEVDFLDDMSNRVVKYGSRTALSQKQFEWLNRIAEKLGLYKMEHEEL